MNRTEYLNNRLEMLEKKWKQKKKLVLKHQGEIVLIETKIYELKSDLIDQEMWDKAEKIYKDRWGKNE